MHLGGGHQPRSPGTTGTRRAARSSSRASPAAAAQPGERRPPCASHQPSGPAYSGQRRLRQVYQRHTDSRLDLGTERTARSGTDTSVGQERPVPLGAGDRRAQVPARHSPAVADRLHPGRHLRDRAATAAGWPRTPPTQRGGQVRLLIPPGVGDGLRLVAGQPAVGGRGQRRRPRLPRAAALTRLLGAGAPGAPSAGHGLPAVTVEPSAGPSASRAAATAKRPRIRTASASRSNAQSC